MDPKLKMTQLDKHQMSKQPKIQRWMKIISFLLAFLLSGNWPMPNFVESNSGEFLVSPVSVLINKIILQPNKFLF